MIWLTWRQLRTQATLTLAVLAALAVVLASTGPQLADLHTTAGRDLIQQLTSTDTALYFAGGVA
ncbi:transporter, partial [Streptomyces sp. NPDC053728]